MGGWKQKSGWIQILPDSCVPFTFPFLSQLFVCLIVLRVRAYLTTDQQKNLEQFLSHGLRPLVGFYVWTCINSQYYNSILTSQLALACCQIL